jgi:hypothetical protein
MKRTPELTEHVKLMLEHMKKEQDKLLTLSNLIHRVDTFIANMKMTSEVRRTERDAACRLLIECSDAIHFLIDRYQLPNHPDDDVA